MTEQPKHNPPHGMEKYDLGGKDDLGALSLAQQADLNQFKVGGWRYALARKIGAFSFVPLSEFVGRPSWTKSG